MSEAAGRVVSAVSVAATLISILSVGGAISVAEVGWGWALPATVLAAITVIFAIWASIPRADEIRPGDLEDVDRYFKRQLRLRSRLLNCSAVTLCLALIAMPLPFAAATLQSPSPQLSLAASRSGAAIEFSAHAYHVSPGHTRLDLKLETDFGKELLGRRSDPQESAMALTASLPLRVVPPGAVITASLYRDGELVLMRCVHLQDR